ncbi:UDP-glucosyltransferase 2-like [Palaemon carinicauda]|uniref:UDP-glucosyltransferase 2-like n=1 Tax=Palaemon carinicauda TaxID=392227 RepID=UPI0035B64D7D
MVQLSSVLVMVVIVLIVDPSTAKQFNVLIFSPIGSRSVYHLTIHLSEILADAGHLVTHVSTFGPSSKHQNVTEIPTGASVEHLEDINIFHYRNSAAGFDWISDVTEKVGHKMWMDERIRRLWERRHDFDAFIILSSMNEIVGPFLMDYGGAVVTLCTSAAAPELLFLARQGHWLPLSVTPNGKFLYDEHSSFFERLFSPWRTWFLYKEYRQKSIFVAQKILDQYIPKMPSVEKLFERNHLSLINGHFTLDGPLPLLPNQIEIGSITSKSPKPLPKDLEEFAESSGDAGIILFSLGSIVRSRDIPHEYKVVFLKAFRKLSQKVIWKYEEDDLDLPPNVIARKWLPQQDILGKIPCFLGHPIKMNFCINIT